MVDKFIRNLNLKKSFEQLYNMLLQWKFLKELALNLKIFFKFCYRKFSKFFGRIFFRFLMLMFVFGPDGIWGQIRKWIG